MKNKRRFAFNFLAIIALILLLFASYNYIFYPAYASYLSSCQVKTPEEITEETGTITIASTTREYSEEGEQTITVDFFYDDLPDSIYRHEWIHIKQFESNRLISCEYPTTVYMTELEAYTGQYLPDWVFIPMYGDYRGLKG